MQNAGLPQRMPVSQTVVAAVAVAVVVADVVVVALVGAELVPSCSQEFLRLLLLICWHPRNATTSNGVITARNMVTQAMHRSEVVAVALARGSVEL